MADEFEVRLYRTREGRCPFDRWFDSLDQRVQVRVDARIARLRCGNFGDTKSVGGGIHELRLSFGSGYRIYFGREGARIVILLSGGDKRRQAADIAAAKDLWLMYQKEKTHAHH